MILLALVGCMPLDGNFFNPIPQDGPYAFSDAVIPADALEEVTFTSGDGTVLDGLWAHQDPPKPPLIFFHGNTGNLAYDDNWAHVEALWSWGDYDVFTADYRGYGRSEGEPDFEGVVLLDGVAIADYVATTSGAAPEAIPWVGHSLGGAVALHTSATVPSECVVTESTFASARDLLDDTTNTSMPAGWFFADPFDNAAAAAEITAPLLVIHGLDDDYIPPSEAVLLYDAAPDPKELWQPDGVGHGDITEVMPDEFRDRVEGFIDAQR